MIPMTLARRVNFRHFVKATGIAVALSLILAGCGGLGAGGSTGATGGQSSKKDKNGPGVFDPKSTMAKIQQRKKLNVGVVFNQPPFADENSVTGSPEGFDIDLVQWLAMGIFGSSIEGKINYIELNPRDRELALDQNKVDIVVGRYDVSAARKRFVDFAGPYYVTSQALVVLSRPQNRADSISSALQLSGKKVCTVRGSTNFEALAAVVPSVDMTVQRNSATECGAELVKGTVFGVAADAADMSSFVVSAGGDVRILTTGFGELPYGVGVKKDVNDLREFLNTRISAWKDYQKASDRWLSNVPGRSSQQPTVDRY